MSECWGIEWYSRNKLDGESRHVMWEYGRPLMFDTRREAREYVKSKYGYIGRRADLKAEPHGWRIPRPVRVRVVVEKVGEG